MRESNFQLVEKPRITRILFELNKQFILEDHIQLELNNDINIIKNSDEQKYDSIVVLNLSIFESRDLAEVPFKLDLDIEGHFMWDANLAKDTYQLDNLLKQNAPAILYSYLRPIITSITVDANMPALVIPVMNFCE